MNQQKPTLGRIVHAVFDHGDSHRGQVTRPAIIVRVWSDEMVNVQAFTDGGYGQSTNDNRPPVLWLTSLHYDSERQVERTMSELQAAQAGATADA